MIKSDELIKELLQSLLSRYQSGLKTLIKGNDFIFDCVHLLYYKCRKINFKRGSWCIDSLNCLKTKKASINTFNKKDKKCFKYAVTVPLNHKKNWGHPKKITNIKLF